MELPATKPAKTNRWLPYWAVFQADVRQTLRSWVYRTWVLVFVLAAAGYLLFHGGVQHKAGMIQLASKLNSDLLRWTFLGSVTLIIVLTAGSISSERGTMADSVLSRGISRYQYFLAKWHARLLTILGTFLAMGLVALASSFFLVQEDLSLVGSLVALLTITVVLSVVVSCGVTVSAMTNSTVLGIAVLWIWLYGTGFALWFLPNGLLSAQRLLGSLPYTLRGYYDLHELGRLAGWSAIISCVVAAVGLIWFSRRDV